VKTFDILQKQTIIQPKFYALKQILMKKLRLWNKLDLRIYQYTATGLLSIAHARYAFASPINFDR